MRACVHVLMLATAAFAVSPRKGRSQSPTSDFAYLAHVPHAVRLSPYTIHLQRCVDTLADAHTRTPGWEACVFCGSGVDGPVATSDKWLKVCARVRVILCGFMCTREIRGAERGHLGRGRGGEQPTSDCARPCLASVTCVCVRRSRAQSVASKTCPPPVSVGLPPAGI